jgi:type II secretory ATPase GspE/PulE/Tfp pilus assembly ATPase PilB-like protein
MIKKPIFPKKPTHIKTESGESAGEAVTHLKVDATAEEAKKKPAAVAPARPRTPAQVGPEVAFRIKFQQISNKIQASHNLDEILNSLKTDIAELFESEKITVYVIDGVKRELVSRIKSGNDLQEIRVLITTKSIAGYAAYKQRLINIKNVYDDEELKAIDGDLTFDKSWDKRTGFVTRQMLVCPIFFHKYLLGAIQLINRKTGNPYSKQDELSVKELAKTLGIAMYNQKRAARQANHKFSYLLQKHLLTQKELSNAIGEAKKRRESIENYLIQTVKIPKKDIIESLSKYFEIPGVEYDSKWPIPVHLLKKGREAFMKANLWVPLESEADKVIIAIDNPQDLQKVDMIKQLYPTNPLEFRVTLPEDVLEFIKLFTTEPTTQSTENIDDILDELQRDAQEEDMDVDDELNESDSAVVKLVNKIVVDSYHRRASDIHIEPYPGKQNTLVRIRIDGACTVYQTIPAKYRSAIASRIKIMANLDIAERRLPQDGKIQFKKYGGLDIELRVATIPTQGALEDIVMRILAAGDPIPLAKMRFSEHNITEFIRIIEQPYGIIFVCGPTGSGKTTTLHSALAHINKTETKIWTAEDPVEITQKGLRQVQVQPKIGFTFPIAMRAFLRADPDVIMVGEMRDKETTSIGIEASLTGHLVFSTLHTNSAPESVTRLLDMGMDPFNFADAVLGILAQRLGRTLCSDCKEPYNPSEEEYNELRREYGEVMFDRDLKEKYPLNKTLMLNRPKGCEKCGQSGYRGRIGIHELMIGTLGVKRLIQQQGRVEEIRDQALKDGMRTLKQDGITKVFEGYIDLMGVRKVCID